MTGSDTPTKSPPESSPPSPACWSSRAEPDRPRRRDVGMSWCCAARSCIRACCTISHVTGLRSFSFTAFSNKRCSRLNKHTLLTTDRTTDIVVRKPVWRTSSPADRTWWQFPAWTRPARLRARSLLCGHSSSWHFQTTKTMIHNHNTYQIQNNKHMHTTNWHNAYTHVFKLTSCDLRSLGSNFSGSCLYVGGSPPLKSRSWLGPTHNHAGS